ncbi:hypothetical protein DFJ58DRAFT_912872 [Suillus subalutaceus]|uniref:uncharacterized protein n=1 Tax=Suillus subalutaceus TaxID=48586 RepID=UPI001B8813EA|nr:uncharacterized protein DFJ58DRAFT_912872 [Suillus subalutaceus]KAG1860611.1 hypothetical protein DFJ58DRAFT_912872 [Suillus subalutaceus]
MIVRLAGSRCVWRKQRELIGKTPLDVGVRVNSLPESLNYRTNDATPKFRKAPTIFTTIAASIYNDDWPPFGCQRTAGRRNRKYSYGLRIKEMASSIVRPGAEFVETCPERIHLTHYEGSSSRGVWKRANGNVSRILHGLASQVPQQSLNHHADIAREASIARDEVAYAVSQIRKVIPPLESGWKVVSKVGERRVSTRMTRSAKRYVTVGTPTQCDPLNISWTGGQAPFEILLTRSLAPSSQVHRLRANLCAFKSWATCKNYTVRPSAFSNGQGSYSISQLTLSTGTSFLLTMSDATGFGSGGTTNVSFVGNPVANNNCNTTVLSTPYMWELSPLPLLQCSQFTVATGSGAVLPITIVQLIPGGQPVIFNSNSYTFTSVVDVNAGTNLLYFVSDSQGRQGGVSGFEQVSGSSNSSCASTNSPSSTAGISATATSASTATGSPTASSSSPSPTSSSSSSNVALIAGAAGGGGVLIVLAILGVCLWRKRRASRSPDVQSSITSYPRDNFAVGTPSSSLNQTQHSRRAPTQTLLSMGMLEVRLYHPLTTECLNQCHQITHCNPLPL